MVFLRSRFLGLLTGFYSLITSSKSADIIVLCSNFELFLLKLEPMVSKLFLWNSFWQFSYSKIVNFFSSFEHLCCNLVISFNLFSSFVLKLHSISFYLNLNKSKFCLTYSIIFCYICFMVSTRVLYIFCCCKIFEA